MNTKTHTLNHTEEQQCVHFTVLNLRHEVATCCSVDKPSVEVHFLFITSNKWMHWSWVSACDMTAFLSHTHRAASFSLFAWVNAFMLQWECYYSITITHTHILLPWHGHLAPTLWWSRPLRRVLSFDQTRDERTHGGYIHGKTLILLRMSQ